MAVGDHSVAKDGRSDGWVVMREDEPMNMGILGSVPVSSIVAGPFPTPEEAEQEAARLRA